VVVIEAPRGSGALITADRALELGRPVFAVPGPLGASSWEGSNRYIADRKAHLLISAADVLSPLGLTVPHILPRPVASAAIDRALDLLASGAADADAIAGSLGLPAAEATTLIADMLLTGRIAATGDGRFART
jgi:DNA processing protein